MRLLYTVFTVMLGCIFGEGDLVIGQIHPPFRFVEPHLLNRHAIQKLPSHDHYSLPRNKVALEKALDVGKSIQSLVTKRILG